MTARRTLTIRNTGKSINFSDLNFFLLLISFCYIAPYMKAKQVITVIFIAVYTITETLYAAGPFCVAHRSLGYSALENSLEAFESASKANASAIEFDLLHTKDGKTIVYHDKKLDRLVIGSKCPKGRKIKELNFKEIRAFCKLENGEVIPTLEESLQLLSQYNPILFIEFKDEQISVNDLDLIKYYYVLRPEKIMIISFLEDVLMKVEKRKKVDPFFKLTKTIKLKKIGYNANIDSFSGISAKYINKKHVQRLQQDGKLVGAYTKSSEEKILKYLAKGVDFVTTNNSPLCESLLDTAHN